MKRQRQEEIDRVFALARKLEIENSNLRVACKRLVAAGSARDSVMGDPCALLAAQNELRAAVSMARAICESVR